MSYTEWVRKEKASQRKSGDAIASPVATESPIKNIAAGEAVSKTPYVDFVRQKKAQQQNSGSTAIAPAAKLPYDASEYSEKSPSTTSYTDFVRRKKEAERNSTAVVTGSANRDNSVKIPSDTKASDLAYTDFVGKKKAESSAYGWAKAAASLLDEMQTQIQSWSYKNVHADYSDKISSLLSQADTWRRQYAGNENAVAYIDSVASALSDLEKAASSATTYYAQWDSEDAYNQALAAYNLAQEQLTYDTVAGQKELDDLQELLNQADQITTWYSMYDMNPGAWDGETISKNMAIYDQLMAYGGKDALNQIVQETQSYLNTAKKLQEKAKYESVADPTSDHYDPDFAKKSLYDSTKVAGETLVHDDLIYETINTIDRKHNEHKASRYTLSYEYMTDNEVAIFNYYYNTAGKETAEKYIALISDELQARKEGKILENTIAFANEHPFWASVGSMGTSLASGMEYLVDLGAYAWDKLSGKDAHLDTNMFAKQTNAIRGTVSEKVDWEIGNWDAFDFLYNTTMSGVDSLTSGVMFGGMGGAVLGLSAAAQATNDALERGMSDGQAFWHGLAAGTFEGIFETFSIGNFKALKEVAPDGVKAIIKNLGKSMLVNASEETLTELANITYDTLVNGEFANYTLEELANGAWKDALGQVLEAGASGALMGFGMGSIGNAMGRAKANQQYRAAGNAIMGVEGGVDALKGLSQQVSEVSAASLAKQAGKVTGNVASGKGSIGKAVAKVKNAVNARRVGKLFQVTVDAVTEQNKIQLEQSMVSHGIEQSRAKQLADTIVGYMCGDDLTAAQLNTLANLSTDMQVLAAMQDTFGSKDSTAYQLGEKAADIAKMVGMEESGQQAAADALKAEPANPAESADLSQKAKQSAANSVAATPQELLSQAEAILGAENLSAQEQNLLATYRQHLSQIQDLEQQLQTLQDESAALGSASGTQNSNRFAANRNGMLLSGVKAQLEKTKNALSQAMDRPQFASFLQKLQAAEATAQNNSQIQTNVLDSSEKYSTINADEFVESTSPKHSESAKPVDIKLKFMEKWTEEQRQQAREKLKALSAAKTVKQAGKTKNRSKRQLYKTSYGEDSIPESYDVDHIVDIQLGGDPNSIDNLQVLDRSVNRSLGAQIMHAIKDYPPGTAFGTFTIE